MRYSIINPSTYFENNLKGFFNILKLSKELKVKHLVYASSSSVYGGIKKNIFKEKDRTDYPMSFYAATKKIMNIWLTRLATYIIYLLQE